MLSRLRKLFRRAAGIGPTGERLAERYLRKRGLQLLARNVRVGHGEIDLVLRDDSTLVFVEVKSRTRREGVERTGLEKLDARKRRALRRACCAYRRRWAPWSESFRLDVVAVEFDDQRRECRGIEWFPAFFDLDAET